jgi:hypothetical protein
LTEDAKPVHVAEQLYKKSWKELEALEHNERILFPDVISRRRSDGSIENIEVMFQVPREPDHRKAKIEARKVGLKEGFDLDRDKDVFEQLETLCLLSICIRNRKEPYEPWEPDVLKLEKRYDLQSLANAYGKIDVYAGMINPHPSELSEQDCWALVAAIVKARNMLPLLVYAPDSQNTFALFMADQVVTCPAYKSYLESLEESIQGSSPAVGSETF